MEKYNVRIDLNSITYTLEAENQDTAIELAKEFFENESHYDILKWANFEIKEI